MLHPDPWHPPRPGLQSLPPGHSARRGGGPTFHKRKPGRSSLCCTSPAPGRPGQAAGWRTPGRGHRHWGNRVLLGDTQGAHMAEPGQIKDERFTHVWRILKLYTTTLCVLQDTAQQLPNPRAEQEGLCGGQSSTYGNLGQFGNLGEEKMTWKLAPKNVGSSGKAARNVTPPPNSAAPRPDEASVQ